MYSIFQMSKKPTIDKPVPVPTPLEQLSQAQRERLCFIDFNLYFLGEMGRVELATKFDVTPAVFTRDMAIYREYAPDNLVFNDKLKRYEVTSAFKPVFEHDVHRVLFALSEGFGEGLNQASRGYLPAEFPLRLNQPDVSVLAVIGRAIKLRKVVRVSYLSYSSGASKRELIPYALAGSGTRWHIRSYDRKSQQFRDFAINRISRPTMLDDPVQSNEQQEHDHQWLRMVQLQLVPHPKASRPDVIEADYAMREGVLNLNVRASNAGYALQHWGVDCSQDASLDPQRYRLWLPNADRVLHGVETAVLAPAYEQ